jgi:hypothetical protein
MEYVGGKLEPGESEHFAVSDAVSVEFLIDEKTVVSASFPKDPGQVMLVEKDGELSIAVLDEKSVAA